MLPHAIKTVMSAIQDRGWYKNEVQHAPVEVQATYLPAFVGTDNGRAIARVYAEVSSLRTHVEELKGMIAELKEKDYKW